MVERVSRGREIVGLRESLGGGRLHGMEILQREREIAWLRESLGERDCRVEQSAGEGGGRLQG